MPVTFGTLASWLATPLHVMAWLYAMSHGTGRLSQSICSWFFLSKKKILLFEYIFASSDRYLKWLAQNAVGALSLLRSKFKRLMCDTSLPMMRRLFDALVLPAVSYGSEVWGPLCSPVLPPDIKKMADIQVSFLRQLCCLKRSVTPVIMFRELTEKPWVHRWWGQVVGFMRRLSVMPEGSIHRDILMDNVADAQDHPSYSNWANGVMRQYTLLGMASPFSSSGIVGLNAFKFQTCMQDRLRRVWDECHVSPRTAPSKGAKLCTYFAWFFRPSQLTFEPYCDIPMPISRLRLLLQCRMGPHSLPVERGRLARPAICAGAHSVALGLQGMSGIWCLIALILPMFAASSDRYLMMLMGRCSCSFGIPIRRPFVIVSLPFLAWQMTRTRTCPHKPMLAEWTI